MKNVSIKLSNIEHNFKLRAICNKCFRILASAPRCNKCKTHDVIIEVNTKHGWVDEEYVCCGKHMELTGLKDCNGWKCKNCGHEVPDIASMKF